VAEAVFFGAEVINVVWRGCNLDGDLLDDFDAVDFESAGFLGVIGEYFDLFESEVTEDLGADAVVAFVGGKAEFDVGVNGVEALLLEFVGVEFVFEADASAFLAEIDQGANACLLNHLQGRDELLATLASLGMKKVAGHTFGVDADEDRFVVGDGFAGAVEVADGAFTQRQMRFG